MTENFKINGLKQIDLVVLPPRNVLKKIQLTKRIIEATLIKISLVTFLISVCLKIHIVPHDGKKGNFWKVDAWKHIDLVVYHTRNVYNFFQVIGRFAEATLIKFSLVTLLFGIYRVLSLTDLYTGFIKPKITKIAN